MPDTRVPLKAWAYRGLGLMLVHTSIGLEGEIWDGETLRAVIKLGTATQDLGAQRLQQRASEFRPLARLKTAPPSARQRVFADRGNRLWRVSEAVSARWNWDAEGDGLRDRALLFDSEDEHCRLTTYPPNWDDLSDTALEGLLGMAECAWRRGTG